MAVCLSVLSGTRRSRKENLRAGISDRFWFVARDSGANFYLPDLCAKEEAAFVACIIRSAQPGVLGCARAALNCPPVLSFASKATTKEGPSEPASDVAYAFHVRMSSNSHSMHEKIDRAPLCWEDMSVLQASQYVFRSGRRRSDAKPNGVRIQS